jgi:hypothetical protein
MRNERAGKENLERETGFEPATSTLARSHSTTELLPLVASFYSICRLFIYCTLPALLPVADVNRARFNQHHSTINSLTMNSVPKIVLLWLASQFGR